MRPLQPRAQNLRCGPVHQAAIQLLIQAHVDRDDQQQTDQRQPCHHEGAQREGSPRDEQQQKRHLPGVVIAQQIHLRRTARLIVARLAAHVAPVARLRIAAR